MSETGKKLMILLKEIYNDHDFVCGTMSNCGNEEALKELYDYISYAKAHNKAVTSDEILLLSLVIGDGDEKEKKRLFRKGGVAVATL